MASVRKNPTVKGTLRWQAVWAERADGGRTQRRTKNFDTQKEAREHAQRMEVEVERRGIGDPQKHSLERYLKRWLATLTERGELSPTTLAAYRWQADIACRHIGHIRWRSSRPPTSISSMPRCCDVAGSRASSIRTARKAPGR